MNPYFLALLIYFLGLSGLVALTSLLTFPSSLGKIFTQTLARSVVAACRIASAVTTLLIVPLKSAEPFLEWAIWAAPTSYLLWELTGIVAEHRGKVAAARMTVLEKNVDQLRMLLTLLGDLIALKRSAIARSITTFADQTESNSLRAKQHLQRVQATLSPSERISELLKSLASLFVFKSRSAERSRSTPQNFRVCLYLEVDGFMVEKASFATNTQTTAGTRSSTSLEFRHKFEISNKNDPAVIVESVQNQSAIIVADCPHEHKIRADKQRSFYFNEAQKQYLKSLICYPLDLSHDPKKNRWAVLAVDTNVTGHFPSDADGFFEDCLVEYLKRIDLELVYEELLGLSADPGSRKP